jgi:predicted glycosyltransferase
MWWSRVYHWFFGHPKVYDIKEEYVVVEDIIAETSYVGMSGWCESCKRRVAWTEEYT